MRHTHTDIDFIVNQVIDALITTKTFVSFNVKEWVEQLSDDSITFPSSGRAFSFYYLYKVCDKYHEASLEDKKKKKEKAFQVIIALNNTLFKCVLDPSEQIEAYAQYIKDNFGD